MADDNAAVYEVFRVHFDRLVRAVTHPTALITMLYSKKLISDTDKTKIFTAPTDDLDKATRLMNAVEATMRAAPKASQVVFELCEAVTDEPALKHVADSIRSALGEMIRRVRCCCSNSDDDFGERKKYTAGGLGAVPPQMLKLVYASFFRKLIR